MPQPRLILPVWITRGVWVSIFLSPTAYFLLLLLASKFRINLPETVAWTLFFLIPAIALLICESVVWRQSRTVARRIAFMLLTLLGMLLQFGILALVLRAILVAATAYVQSR